NRNLRDLVEKGEFREDLFYRLKVVEIDIPPLRERAGDIPLLVDHFVQVFNKKFKKTIYHISDEVLNVFMRYAWPGNIRELEHALERASVLCRGEIIELEHIPPEIISSIPTDSSSVKPNLSDSPDELLEALNKTGWNKTKAARLLGVNRRTIYRRLSRSEFIKPDDLV
ncbi:helix-turn-helix domain-containing protein, partial [bacterium]|nr:helix-turn-helix domain-containing protein [bacterium]